MPPGYQPNQSQSYDQGLDASYLDQIAAPAQQKIMNPFILWGLIGGALLIVIIFIMVLFSSGQPSSAQRMNNFLFRVDALNSLVKDSQKTIRNPKLHTANGSLSSILTSIQTETTKFLNKSGSSDKKVRLKPPKGSPILAEYIQINKKIDEARLNAIFDRVYAREVAYQIAKLRTEMVPIYKDTSSKKIREFLENSDKDLKALSEDIKKIN
ncbi:hypothetical protein KC952_03750 [Candidatus Saccharibacteria bacterium]|jgi:hypothetical protein|nr:hypothetical protein [Candidatus Saccharibacteria bacterium]